MIMGSNKIVPKVAREYIDRGCGVFPASAELLDQMEIAALSGVTLDLSPMLLHTPADVVERGMAVPSPFANRVRTAQTPRSVDSTRSDTDERTR